MVHTYTVSAWVLAVAFGSKVVALVTCTGSALARWGVGSGLGVALLGGRQVVLKSVGKLAFLVVELCVYAGRVLLLKGWTINHGVV